MSPYLQYLNTFLYWHNVRYYRGCGVWRAVELECEIALLKFIAQGVNVREFELVSNQRHGESSEPEGSESESERGPGSEPESDSSSSSERTESSGEEEEAGEEGEEKRGQPDQRRMLGAYTSDSDSDGDSKPDRAPEETQEKPRRPPPYRSFPEESPVCLAPRMGHVEIMKTLLVHGVNPDSVNWGDKTLLMFAARYNHPEMVTLLLNTGVSLDAYDPCRRCALSLAAEYGHTEVVKTLLAHLQIKPDSCSRYYRERGRQDDSPLVRAIQGHHVEIVLLLLDKGVDPRTRSKTDTSALSFLAAGGNPAVVQTLLDKGAEVNVLGSMMRAPSQGRVKGPL